MGSNLNNYLSDNKKITPSIRDIINNVDIFFDFYKDKPYYERNYKVWEDKYGLSLLDLVTQLYINKHFTYKMYSHYFKGLTNCEGDIRKLYSIVLKQEFIKMFKE